MELSHNFSLNVDLKDCFVLSTNTVLATSNRIGYPLYQKEIKEFYFIYLFYSLSLSLSLFPMSICLSVCLSSMFSI